MAKSGERTDLPAPDAGGRPLKGGSRLVQFPMLMEAGDIEAIEHAARAEGVSRAEWLRRAARERLASARAESEFSSGSPSGGRLFEPPEEVAADDLGKEYEQNIEEGG